MRKTGIQTLLPATQLKIEIEPAFVAVLQLSAGQIKALLDDLEKLSLSKSDAAPPGTTWTTMLSEASRVVAMRHDLPATLGDVIRSGTTIHVKVRVSQVRAIAAHPFWEGRQQFQQLRRLRSAIAWVIRKQLAVGRVLCNIQREYLAFENDLDLKPLNETTVATALLLHPSTISRLMSGLELRLPSGKIVPSSHLTPGVAGCKAMAVNHCLDQLRRDEAHFSNGYWKCTAEELRLLVLKRSGVEVSRRSLANRLHCAAKGVSASEHWCKKRQSGREHVHHAGNNSLQ